MSEPIVTATEDEWCWDGWDEDDPDYAGCDSEMPYLSVSWNQRHFDIYESNGPTLNEEEATQLIEWMQERLNSS